ncbi:MAG: molybdopterin-binding protein [Adlercreutzia sp.]|nr:molybdopterin-binding protein [Adlercreutzia sp.]
MIPRTEGHVGKPVRFQGTAYDFGHSIAAIQFSLDDGEHWTTYETPGTNDYQNLTWIFDYTPEQPGDYVLRIRSMNDAGDVSPESAFAELHVEP